MSNAFEISSKSLADEDPARLGACSVWFAYYRTKAARPAEKNGCQGRGGFSQKPGGLEDGDSRADTETRAGVAATREQRTNATLTGVSPNKESKDLRQFPLSCGCHWTFSSLAFISIEVTTPSGWPLA